MRAQTEGWGRRLWGHCSRREGIAAVAAVFEGGGPLVPAGGSLLKRLAQVQV